MQCHIPKGRYTHFTTKNRELKENTEEFVRRINELLNDKEEERERERERKRKNHSLDAGGQNQERGMKTKINVWRIINIKFKINIS